VVTEGLLLATVIAEAVSHTHEAVQVQRCLEGWYAWQASTPQSAGQTNRGDGGGSIFTNLFQEQIDYAGGSGIVIIRYLT
jgi:hypothetical protein